MMRQAPIPAPVIGIEHDEEPGADRMLVHLSITWPCPTQHIADAVTVAAREAATRLAADVARDAEIEAR